ncbi:MAG: tetratricopeptide repeat protein [Aestuariivirga sp.]
MLRKGWGTTFFAAIVAVSLAAPVFAQSLEELPFSKKLKLAKVGDEEAQMAVAAAYESGNGAKTDEAEAAKWYRQAALQGNSEAQFRLARIVSKGVKGVKKDAETAFKLYLDAAGKGHALSQNAVGHAYQNAIGVKADDAKAIEWYRKASDAKLAVAQNNLGIMYLNGKGITRNLDEAFKLFKLAADQGDGWGLNNLGGMYEMGWGTAADKKKAIELYGQAETKGIAAAGANRKRLDGAASTANSQ